MNEAPKTYHLALSSETATDILKEWIALTIHMHVDGSLRPRVHPLVHERALAAIDRVEAIAETIGIDLERVDTTDDGQIYVLDPTEDPDWQRYSIAAYFRSVRETIANAASAAKNKRARR